MSQVITNAFEQYWQSSLAAEQPVVLDEFILADIPNLDITSPIDPDAGLPPESQIVHRQNVDQRGRINNNAVAYTIVMDTTVGDFSFNAMYLRNKQNGVIGMIVYKGRETKLKTDQTTGQTGNSLVKSMLMGYDQAAEATLTHVDAGTWQIDYAARLRGQDEDLRQLASQLYGHHTFIGDGFKVVQQAGGHQVTPGVAIVGGLRIELNAPEVIYPGSKPIGVWVDVHRAGSLLSEHQNHFTIITSVADLTDHVDSNGYQHYVAKLGTVQADNTVVDGRGNTSNGETSIPDALARLEQADEMLGIASWEALQRSYANAGYILRPYPESFQDSGTLTSAFDVLLDKISGKAYTGAGPFPQDVAENTNPSSGGFVDKSSVLATEFLTVDAMKSSTALVVGNRVTWRGYYAAMDGGGNSGTVRAGTPALVDNGSIFVINASLYVEADMLWPTIRQFGGGTDGETGITAAGNLAAMNNLLAYSTKTGKRVYSSTVKAMSVSAGVKVTLDNALDFFGTKAFKLKWASNTDNLVDIATPAGVTKSGVSLHRLNTDGGKYGVYVHAGKFGDNLTNVVDDVNITGCKAQNSYLAGHHVYHGQNVDVSHNFYYKCGDNGAYISFSRTAQCTHNMAHNCRGSAGVVMGYSDTVIAKGLLASDNIIWNDADSANVPGAAAPTSLGGVWMGHCEEGTVSNNTIYNDTKSLAIPIKSGIWVDENSIRNVKVFGNHMTHMREHDVVVGITAGSKIYDVEVTDNTGSFARDGVRVYRGGSVLVKDNAINFTTQRGIKIEAGVKSAEVIGNKLKCCSQQETFNNFYVIENLADRAINIDNVIDDTPDKITLVDPSGTVTVKVDPTKAGIDVLVSGALVATIPVVRGTTIWGDVHTAIIAISQLSGSTFVGNPDQEVLSIKRTGAATVEWVVEEPANGYILSYAPPLGYLKQTGGVCRRNKILSDYLSCKITSGNIYNTQKCNSLTNVTDRDTNDWGGGRDFVGAVRPTTGYYRQGDTVGNKLDGGSFAERCTASGYPGTWVTA